MKKAPCPGESVSVTWSPKVVVVRKMPVAVAERSRCTVIKASAPLPPMPAFVPRRLTDHVFFNVSLLKRAENMLNPSARLSMVRSGPDFGGPWPKRSVPFRDVVRTSQRQVAAAYATRSPCRGRWPRPILPRESCPGDFFSSPGAFRFILNASMPALASRLIALSSPVARALVYPERGFQLFGFQVKHEDRWIETIYAPDDDVEATDRRYGNPVLFPAVGVSNGHAADSWDYQGRTLPMPSHGWARNVYWQIEDVSDSAVTAVLVPHPGFKLGFPFDFVVRMTYRLEDATLVIETSVHNTGASTFPYALGFHPYLKLPLTASSTLAECVVDLPAANRVRSMDGWRSFEATAAAARTVGVTDPELPGSILLRDGGASFLQVRDEAAALATRVSVEESPEAFPVWVVWNAAADAPYVCLEPWTDVPNALNRTSTLMLSPRQIHNYRVAISLHAL